MIRRDKKVDIPKHASIRRVVSALLTGNADDLDAEAQQGLRDLRAAFEPPKVSEKAYDLAIDNIKTHQLPG